LKFIGFDLGEEKEKTDKKQRREVLHGRIGR
jgi:hypothetical protein